MRDLTPEEKELIVNTEITPDVFNIPKTDISCTTLNYISQLEQRRKEIVTGYQPRGIDTEFDILVRLLPNSYKVVNLCAEQEKKDFCKYKHKVSGKEVSVSSIGTTSDAFPCYEVYSCDKCDYFEM